MKKSTQILRTLHSWLKADDIDNFMVALNAVMSNNFIVWKQKFEVEGEWTKYGFTHETVQDFFMYEVDSPAMDRDFWRFQELCESCMDLAMVGKVNNLQHIF